MRRWLPYRTPGSMRVGSYDGEAAAWDAFVRPRDGWTAFHLFGWKRIMESALGHECVYLAAHDADGQLAGVLPLVRVKSRLFGHYLVSLPFVNYGGPPGSAAPRPAPTGGPGEPYARERPRSPLNWGVGHRL